MLQAPQCLGLTFESPQPVARRQTGFDHLESHRPPRLILLGFVATDFVITRSLSLADASVHLIHNPIWQEHVTWVGENRETVREWFPEALQGAFLDFWNEKQLPPIDMPEPSSTAHSAPQESQPPAANAANSGATPKPRNARTRKSARTESERPKTLFD